MFAGSSQSAGQHDILEVMSSSADDAASMEQDVSEQVCLVLLGCNSYGRPAELSRHPIHSSTPQPVPEGS